jgi:pimeloyl-ACP methyl ester carboxylesterase
VLAQGQGPLIVLLPSLGRGATDFDPIADRLADAAFRVLRPEPRGIGFGDFRENTRENRIDPADRARERVG